MNWITGSVEYKIFGRKVLISTYCTIADSQNGRCLQVGFSTSADPKPSMVKIWLG
jgi:hypothetical protein